VQRPPEWLRTVASSSGRACCSRALEEINRVSERPCNGHGMHFLSFSFRLELWLDLSAGLIDIVLIIFSGIKLMAR
jgi:hypothetical protein